MKSNVIFLFLGRMLTIPKNQGRGKEVPEPRPLQRLRRRKIPLITKPLCQPQNQGQKSNQRSKKPLQRKKNMSMLYSSVMSVSSISVHFLSNWLLPYCGISWIIGISKHLWFRYCYCKKNWKSFYVLSWPNKTIPFKLLQRRCDIKDIHLSFDLDISNFRNTYSKERVFLLWQKDGLSA